MPLHVSYCADASSDGLTHLDVHHRNEFDHRKSHLQYRLGSCRFHCTLDLYPSEDTEKGFVSIDCLQVSLAQLAKKKKLTSGSFHFDLWCSLPDYDRIGCRPEAEPQSCRYILAELCTCLLGSDQHYLCVRWPRSFLLFHLRVSGSE